jgi:hypothetical protein
MGDRRGLGQIRPKEAFHLVDPVEHGLPMDVEGRRAPLPRPLVVEDGAQGVDELTTMLLVVAQQWAQPRGRR